MAKKDGFRPPFPWRRAAAGAVTVGIGTSGTAASCTAATFPDPATIATVAAIGFVGGTASNFCGEVVKHYFDDPAPLFDGRTRLLFDTVGYVISLMLFVVPALALDHALRPAAPLPGYFGFAALFLSTFLMPVLRGLLINLGLVREEDPRDRIRTGM